MPALYMLVLVLPIEMPKPLLVALAALSSPSLASPTQRHFVEELERPDEDGDDDAEDER